MVAMDFNQSLLTCSCMSFILFYFVNKVTGVKILGAALFLMYD